jgi:hypothetical protein
LNLLKSYNTFFIQNYKNIPWIYRNNTMSFTRKITPKIYFIGGRNYLKMFVGKALFGTAPDEVGGILPLRSAYDSRSLEGEAFGGVWLSFWLCP